MAKLQLDLSGLKEINRGDSALSLADIAMNKYETAKGRDPHYLNPLYLDTAETNLQIAEDEKVDTSAQRARLAELKEKHPYPAL